MRLSSVSFFGFTAQTISSIARISSQVTPVICPIRPGNCAAGGSPSNNSLSKLICASNRSRDMVVNIPK